MPSIDGQIREALRLRLETALAVPGPEHDVSTEYVPPEVILYQAGAYRADDGVLVMVQVGGWQQHPMDGGYPAGQRVLARVYDAEVAILADDRMETLAETLNAMADRCMGALCDWTEILPAGRLQDLSVHAGTYHKEKSEEGFAGVLSLSCTIEVWVSEEALSIAAGGVPTSFI